jgi:hypothetical protein
MVAPSDYALITRAKQTSGAGWTTTETSKNDTGSLRVVQVSTFFGDPHLNTTRLDFYIAAVTE